MLKFLVPALVATVTLAAGFYAGQHVVSHKPVALLAVMSCDVYGGVVVTEADGNQVAMTSTEMPVERLDAYAKIFGKHVAVINPCPFKGTKS